jgi:large subunit ribosomal protein L13
MTTETTTLNYDIDAKGKRLGKVATEAAAVLMGKNTTQFAKHIAQDMTVTITNAGKLDISEKKSTEVYKSYSGYPSGQRIETLGHLGTRRGYTEVLRRSIAGMIPNNKLKKPRLKNLIISE